MKLLAFFVIAVAAFGQTIYLRSPGVGFCRVTNATNATPVRITVSSLSDCGITANGQTIIVVEVGGNRNANIHVENSSDYANLGRKVSGLNTGTNSFDLVNLSDVSVPGSGAYTRGGRVSRTTALTLKSHPRIYMDGPSGAVSTALQDTSSGGLANSGRQQMIALSNAVTNWAATTPGWGDDVLAYHGANGALLYWMNGSSTGLANARYLINNIDMMSGGTSCDDTMKQCGSASAMGNYPTWFIENAAQAYTILRAQGQLSSPEIARYNAYQWNDYPGSLGGFDYATHSVTSWKRRANGAGTDLTMIPGTVSATIGSAVVTGTGTFFKNTGGSSGISGLQAVTAGDVFWLGGVHEDGSAQPYLVQSVDSETQITLNRPYRGGRTGNSYSVSRPWDSSQYGLVWFNKHYSASSDCGGTNDNSTVDKILDWCTDYGYEAGYFTESHNLVQTRLLGLFAAGIASCGDDIRACRAAIGAHEYLMNRSLPRYLTTFTGFGPESPGYAAGTKTNNLMALALICKRSFNEAPDYTTEFGTLGTDYMRWPVAAVYNGWGTNGVMLPHAEQAFIPYSSSIHRGPLLAFSLYPSSSAASWFKDWFENKSGGATSSFIGYNGGTYAWYHMLWYYPLTVSASAPSTTQLFNAANRSLCLSQFVSGVCPDGEARYMYTSRTDWTDTATIAALYANSWSNLDHGGDDVGVWLWLSKGSTMLQTGDAGDNFGLREHKPRVVVGGTISNLVQYPNIAPVVPQWNTGGNTYMAVMTRSEGTFQSSAGVGQVWRGIVDTKSGYVVEYTKVTPASSAIQVRQDFNLNLNGCGAASSTTCASINAGSKTAANVQTSARLHTSILGSVSLATESGTATNGTYTGGRGNVFRYSVCPVSGCSATTSNLEFLAVHRVATSGTQPTLNSISSGGWTGVEIQDSGAPQVVLTSPGKINTTASFTISATSHFIASGLADGSWTLTANGSAVSGCSAVAVTSGALECSAVPSGAIVLSMAGGGGGGGGGGGTSKVSGKVTGKL